jgi:hypothetical protein
MGIKVEEKSKFEVPGPGNYDHEVTIVHKAMPAFT